MATSLSLENDPKNVWKLAKEGIKLLINNQGKEAQALFLQHADDLQMHAGYAVTVFVEALMTFEDEKLTLALNTLKETERRCTSHRSWLQTIKSKVFGAESAETVAQYLESQIILADSLVFLSTLTFLQNDISGYFKGGWLLRKSWKLYQHVYTEISKVYKDVFGPLNLPEPQPNLGATVSSISEEMANNIHEDDGEDDVMVNLDLMDESEPELTPINGYSLNKFQSFCDENNQNLSDLATDKLYSITTTNLNNKNNSNRLVRDNSNNFIENDSSCLIGNDSTNLIRNDPNNVIGNDSHNLIGNNINYLAGNNLSNVPRSNTNNFANSSSSTILKNSNNLHNHSYITDKNNLNKPSNNNPAINNSILDDSTQNNSNLDFSFARSSISDHSTTNNTYTQSPLTHLNTESTKNYFYTNNSNISTPNSPSSDHPASDILSKQFSSTNMQLDQSTTLSRKYQSNQTSTIPHKYQSSQSSTMPENSQTNQPPTNLLQSHRPIRTHSQSCYGDFSTLSSNSPTKYEEYVPPEVSSIATSMLPHFKKNKGLKKSASTNSGFYRQASKTSKLFASKLSIFGSSGALSYLTTSFKIFESEKAKVNNMDKGTIKRLMGAACFGYGLFQLGVSLLPPPLLKLTNILGFSGNRQGGIDNLMFAREGTDMRAPLATLALLWYHTIVRPFYALDGSNVEAGVHSATQLIEESMSEYSESALFLFFKGRTDRLKSDITSAIECFQKSIDNAKEHEVKVLSTHELGWCYLIMLDFSKAENTFQYMRTHSRWSRYFYTYMVTICAGARGTFKDLTQLKELQQALENSPKGNQLEEFLLRRYRICRTKNNNLGSSSPLFWKLLVYEMLYLWNTLPSCSPETINQIMLDCEFVKDEVMIGLAKLITGVCYCIQKRFQEGQHFFRQCLEARKNMPGNATDAHISAFAQYELGLLLLNMDKKEGKNLLQSINQFKDYDFESRLSVRVHMLLKHM